jgi:hypothetical protein
MIAAAIIALAIALVFAAPLAAKEHRSREVTREFQLQHACPSTGKTSGACPDYRKDHIVPLGCGGPDVVSNLQWQGPLGTQGLRPLGGQNLVSEFFYAIKREGLGFPYSAEL